MDPDRHDFDSLRQLLAWKRHEQPPPGYFNDFSTRVIVRLETLEWQRAPSWWERFLTNFDARPVLVSAYSLLVCGALLFGLSFFQIVEGELNSATAGFADQWQTAHSIQVIEPHQNMIQVIESQLRPSPVVSGSSETFPPASFMFEGGAVRAERAGYGNFFSPAP